MTFSNRLRLTLLIVAIVPAALIAGIVVIGTGEQIQRIESREASQACGHFTELLNNSLHRIERNIEYVAGSQAFLIMEMRLESGRRPDPQYRLPILSLDFLEYIDSTGTALLSAERPALVGRAMSLDTVKGTSAFYVFENDLEGSHPSIGVVLPTEQGFLRGGIFLDGAFQLLAQAVTRSEIEFVAKDEDYNPANIPIVGTPYRYDDKLKAILLNEDISQYYIRAHFPSGGQDAVFSNFLTGVGAITVVSLVLVIVASVYFSSRAKREIGVLTEGAGRVASGDFSQPVISESEGELYDLADSFNTMMRQLTEYRKKLIMTEKIAAWQTVGRKVAHEIKNPLTPISIAADDLYRSYREQQPDFEKILTDCTGTIKHEVDRLKKLIDRFSSFAKMPAPEIKPFSAADFIDEISALYKAEIDNKNIGVVNKLYSNTLAADADQLRQVIINLLKNSLEANGAPCNLIFNESDTEYHLTVEDSGPGFPDKIVNEGITPYFSTKAKGSGLGLLICQRIVLDHNGSMSLENKPNGGARVIIYLPKTHA